MQLSKYHTMFTVFPDFGDYQQGTVFKKNRVII